MFKNALLYRIVHWDTPALTALEDRLHAHRFTECGATQPEALGWVEPRGEAHGPLAESVGGQLILKLANETKAVPGGVVLRVGRDGSIPKDNPWLSRPSVPPALYAHGLRDPEGAAINPATGELWTVEHGPQGGDEVSHPPGLEEHGRGLCTRRKR